MLTSPSNFDTYDKPELLLREKLTHKFDSVTGSKQISPANSVTRLESAKKQKGGNKNFIPLPERAPLKQSALSKQNKKSKFVVNSKSKAKDSLLKKKKKDLKQKDLNSQVKLDGVSSDTSDGVKKIRIGQDVCLRVK